MDWHTRYANQAQWTRSLREYILPKAGIESAQRILEVGCGTGAILSAIKTPAQTIGIDIDRAGLSQALNYAPSASLIEADGQRLPFAPQSFDIVYCHFVLLWARDPLKMLIAMKRAAKIGGAIIAFAEPDYSKRMDRPQELSALGMAQREALIAQGADPDIGSRLGNLFDRAEIKLHEYGALGSGAGDQVPITNGAEEWAVIESDLAGIDHRLDLAHLKKIHDQACEKRERTLFVPTFFAWGKVV
jgi:SAM-dependent methyltransferase